MKKKMTKEEARAGIRKWGTLGAMQSSWSKYDALLDEASEVLGLEEYGKIYNTLYQD